MCIVGTQQKHGNENVFWLLLFFELAKIVWKKSSFGVGGWVKQNQRIKTICWTHCRQQFQLQMRIIDGE